MKRRNFRLRHATAVNRDSMAPTFAKAVSCGASPRQCSGPVAGNSASPGPFSLSSPPTIPGYVHIPPVQQPYGLRAVLRDGGVGDLELIGQGFD